jgi:DNA-directed RNA polymerase I subunit RPA1
MIACPFSNVFCYFAISQAISKGQQCMKDFILKKDPQAQLADESAVRDATASLLSGDDRKAQLAAIDSHIMGELSGATSAIIKACLPGGQEKPFPANCFSLMVLTGAKGSMVNHSQVSCALAQQALEGRRVPIMASGKSLPSFEAYDPSPRAGGYITDRFLTGIRPQEYYFHCMAGREGLVDTAVKTSRSGYLQRCLVKHLEELKVCYDGTVRDSEGCIQQFIYGEDGIDTTQSKYLSGQKDQMQFLAENYRALAYKYSLTEDFLDRMGFDLSATLSGHAAVERGTSSAIAAGDFVRARKLSPGQVEWSRSAIAKGWHNARVKKVHTKKSLVKYTLVYADGTVASKVPAEVSVEGRPESALLQSPKSMPLVELFVPPPVLSFLHASSQLGSVSESLQKSINDFIATQPRALDSSVGGINPETFRIMLWVKYMRSLAQAGEAVGAIAAQSVGEPSTQMTLNTFHLAGHGGANVTLGIPRLREIVMTASKNPTTPNMTALLRPSVSREEASEMARRLSKLPLVDLVRPVEGVVVREQLKRDKGGTWYRSYRVEVYFSDLELIRKAFGLSFDQICTASCQVLVSKLLTAATTALKKAGEVHTIKTFNGDGGGMFDAGESGSDSEDEGEGGEGVPAKATLSDDSDSSSDEDDADEPIKVAASVGLQKEGDGEDDEDSLAVWQAMAGKTAPTSQQRKVDNQPKISALSVSKAAQKHKLFAGVSKNKSAGMIAVSLKLPSEARRLMMADIATSTLEKCFVRSYEGIGRAYVVEKVVGGQERLALQMEGCNFATMWRLSPKEGADLLEINHITSSHIHEVCETYGVEACRAAIVSEITAVFGVYGIDVDARHLGLIADYMTFFGGYRPMNRAGMISAPSPFLQMSFETTANYLVQAAMEGKIDKLHGASSRIVMGQVGEMGTGSFDLRLPISTV